MSLVPPVIRYLILCEDVQLDPVQKRRVSLLGLLSAIRPVEIPAYPFIYRELCVFVLMTECRGSSQGYVDIHRAEADNILFQTPPRQMVFGDDPLEIHGITFRIRNCFFREPGLYWFRFWYDGQIVAQQPLLLR